MYRFVSGIILMTKCMMHMTLCETFLAVHIGHIPQSQNTIMACSYINSVKIAALVMLLYKIHLVSIYTYMVPT